MRREREVRVFHVVYYDPRAEGPAGDGTHVARFLSRSAAEAFATGKTCYGKPATADEAIVPARLADRWSFMG